MLLVYCTIQIKQYFGRWDGAFFNKKNVIFFLKSYRSFRNVVISKRRIERYIRNKVKKKIIISSKSRDYCRPWSYIISDFSKSIKTTLHAYNRIRPHTPHPPATRRAAYGAGSSTFLSRLPARVPSATSLRRAELRG